jgi:hypothetical protein
MMFHSRERLREPHQHTHDNGTHHEHEHAQSRMGRFLAAVPFLHEHTHNEAYVDRSTATREQHVEVGSIRYLPS